MKKRPSSSSVQIAAIDLGATSGRVILGTYSKGNLSLEEVHRFPNKFEFLGKNCYWNLPGLFAEVRIGLLKAKEKIQNNAWKNINVFCGDATKINEEWIDKNIEQNLRFDSVLCDLGLSGFPEWQKIIDNLISILKPDGKLVIMDWFIEKSSLRGEFIKWIGKGDVNRPIYQYMEKKYRILN